MQMQISRSVLVILFKYFGTIFLNTICICQLHFKNIFSVNKKRMAHFFLGKELYHLWVGVFFSRVKTQNKRKTS